MLPSGLSNRKGGSPVPQGKFICASRPIWMLMKRYFFHLQAPAGLFADDIGVLLPEDTTVKTEAIKAVRYTLRASRAGGAADWIRWAIKVVSEDGSDVLLLPFDKVALADQLISPSDELQPQAQPTD